MKVPFSWLKEYLPLRLTPERVAERLTAGGLEVEGILQAEGEPVLEVAVTPNRGDCLSVRGVARELSSLLGIPMRRRPAGKKFPTAGRMRELLPVEVKDRSGCPRYALRVIRGVRIGPSPDWLIRRLAQCGVRSINNLVDVTNYVMLDLGQPLHAFDLERIRQKIVVRRAGLGETLVTLDGETRSLTPDDLLIADAAGVLAAAGVMGGRESEVGPATRNIALESAFFDPSSIRRTAKRLGLATESSYRFERRVDPEGIPLGLSQAVSLIVSLAGGVPTTDGTDCNSLPRKARTVSFDPKVVGRLLGGDWSPGEAQRILRRIGLRPAGSRWQVPSHRGDLGQGADLIEEVARIGGYGRIPESLPALSVLPAAGTGPMRGVIRQVRSRLRDLGFHEAVHLSFLSAAELELTPWAGRAPASRAVRIKNPLGLEDAFLRPTLLPSLLKTAAYHHQHRIETARLFEFRKVFRQEEGEVRESLNLAAIASGETWFSHWGREGVDFFALKGILEGLFSGFGLRAEFEPGDHPVLMPGKAAQVLSQGDPVGWIGEIHPHAAERFGLKTATFVWEVEWEAIGRQITSGRRFRPYPRHPQVQRDLALVVEQSVQAGRIRHFLSELDPELIRQVKLFDAYQGSQIPLGKKSLAFSLLLGRDDRTLGEREIDEAWRRILDSVRREFHADIR